MKLDELVTLTKLKKREDIGDALSSGDIFQYEKPNSINYVFHNGEPIRFLTYLEFAPGKERGNHYHKEKEENLFVINGMLEAKFWLLDDSNEILELTLEPGDIVNVKPQVAHVYVSEEGASAIEFSPKKLNYEDNIKLSMEE